MLRKINLFRRWFTSNLEISLARKETIYCDLLESVSLNDLTYWLQVLFAAGIATLGLVLNSPAVIIGAMLISPLMGIILANGLALAAGDLVLAIRAIGNLLLSCAIAIGFALILVAILPFKDMTPEILARTRPTALDLVIALFSGALGSIATCKEPKGVATSIPGVAIAVALMPPLCVVGYGIGVALSLDPVNGFQVARGGGLLFLTNLTAITFMSVLVFLALHIDSPPVRQKVHEWHFQEPESRAVQVWLEKFPAANKLEAIGSLPSRLMIVLIPIFILLFPLSQSLLQLQRELTQQQQNNEVVKMSTELWRERFATYPDGRIRSEINKLFFQEKDNKYIFNLSIFTNQLYSETEKRQFQNSLAKQLKISADKISLQMVEIPTAANEIIARLANPPAPVETTQEAPPTVTETQLLFLQTADAALQGLNLPTPAKFLHYEVSTSKIDALKVNIFYLSPREINPDAQTLIVDNVKNRLGYFNTRVNLLRIPTNQGEITFANNSNRLSNNDRQLLGRIGQILQQKPNLELEISGNLTDTGSDSLTQQRLSALQQFFKNQYQIPANRIEINSTEVDTVRQFKLQIRTKKEQGMM